jgi:ParB/RepB/Spo0J family partition protein
MITEKSIRTLKPHPFNTAVYGQETVDDELLRSIIENGILVPLTIKKDGIIISGHRRYLAAKKAGLKRLPVVVTTFTDELAERLAIIEHNRQRVKSLTQLMREAEELEKIEKVRAKERQGKRHDIKPNIVSTLTPSSENGKTRDKVANMIGMKPITFQKAKNVYEQAKSGCAIAQKALAAVDAGNFSINRAYNELKKHRTIENRKRELAQQNGAINNGNLELPNQTYDVICIDPPWQYSGDRKGLFGRKAACPYPTLSQEELLTLKIPAATDCVLFLWSTHGFLWAAKELLDAWGFIYKATLVWDKVTLGLGSILRMQAEFCLIATKGNPIITTKNHRDIIREPKRQHSRKPEAFYKLVEEITIGRRLDYFSRQRRKGWHSFGNDIDKFSADKK